MVGNYHVIFGGFPSPQKTHGDQLRQHGTAGKLSPVEKSCFEPPKMEFVFLFEMIFLFNWVMFNIFQVTFPGVYSKRKPIMFLTILHMIKLFVSGKPTKKRKESQCSTCQVSRARSSAWKITTKTWPETIK